MENIEILMKFLNKVRKNYRGMEISYSLSDETFKVPIININVTGKFPLPIICYDYFETMLINFLETDRKYFNIPTNKKIMLGEVIYNNYNISKNEIILSEEIKQGVEKIISDYKNRLIVSLGESLRNKNIDLIKNDINFFYETNREDLFFYFSITPLYFSLNNDIFIGFEEIIDFSKYEKIQPIDILNSVCSIINKEMEENESQLNNEFFNLLYGLGYTYNDELVWNNYVVVSSQCVGLKDLKLTFPDFYVNDETLNIFHSLLSFLESKEIN
jgi:hypothetical protein